MRRNLLLLLIALLVVLVPAELVLRARAGKVREAIRAGMDERELCTMPSPDPRLLYTYKPGECGANARGYRDVEHSFEKPDSTYRIVLIGDSVAEGRDVPADSSFGRVLERMLNVRADSVRYEVILLARIGYSTSQEIVLLEEEAFRYDPDLVLWSYCLNDPADPVYHNANGALGAYYYRPRLQLVALAEAFAFRARQKMRGRGCPAEFHAFLHCAYLDRVEADIRRIGEKARAHGVPAAFLVHPLFEDRSSFDDYALADVHQHLGQTALAAGLIPLDALVAFRGHDPHALKINRADYFDPWHMNEAGHRLTAQYLRDSLFSGKPLTPPAGRGDNSG
jgi:lysophospholipase L1-like esterase